MMEQGFDMAHQNFLVLTADASLFRVFLRFGRHVCSNSSPLAQTVSRGSVEAWVNSPQMVETEISRKMWPLSFLLGVQFFLNKTEISTPGGGNRYCDSLFYHMKHKVRGWPWWRGSASLPWSVSIACISDITAAIPFGRFGPWVPSHDCSVLPNASRLVWPPNCDTLNIPTYPNPPTWLTRVIVPGRL